MRFSALICVVIAVFVSGPAKAQGWIEFYDAVWGFSINFPHEPVQEDIQFTTVYQRMVPGRVFRGETETGRYVMTVVSYAGDQTDPLTAVFHAANMIRARGEVTYFDFHDLDGIPGVVISVTEPDGRLVQASLYFIEQRLYIADGSVNAGNPPPSNFWQSIALLDPAGNRIIIDDDLAFP